VIRNWIAFGKPIFATTHGGYTLELANNSSFYSYLRYGKSGTTWDGLGRPHVLPDRTIDESYGIYTQDLQMPFSSGPFDSQPEAAGVISDRSNYESAFQAIRDQPGMFAYACLVRIGRLWQLVPHRLDEDEGASRRWMRYAVGVWYALVFALALAGCWSLWRERRKRANASAQESDEARSGANNSSPRGQWVWGFLMIASFMLVHTFYWTNMRMRAPLMPYIALLAAAGLSFLLARRSRQTA